MTGDSVPARPDGDKASAKESQEQVGELGTIVELETSNKYLPALGQAGAG